MEYIYHLDSPLGGIRIAGTDAALTGLWFDGQARFAETLTEPHEARLTPVFEQTRRWLECYFSGSAPDFTPPLAPRGTAFQLAVWHVLLTIPFGQTTTYGDIASALEAQGGLRPASARAVGGAVGRNPISLIIPCHRVIGADGSLTGYAGGIDRKKRLLALEGAAIR